MSSEQARAYSQLEEVDMNNIPLKPLQDSSKTKMYFYLLALSLCMVILVVFTGLGALIIFLGLEGYVQQQCGFVTSDSNLPTRNFTYSFSPAGVERLEIIMPQEGKSPSNSFRLVVSNEAMTITVFIVERALDNQYLVTNTPQVTFYENQTVSPGMLKISFLEEFQWPGFGCPTVFVMIIIPSFVADHQLTSIFVKNPLTGPTSIQSLSFLETMSVESGSGALLLQDLTISKGLLVNGGYNQQVFISNIQCNGTSQSSERPIIQISTAGPMTLTGLYTCDNIKLTGYNNGFTLTNLNYFNMTLKMMINDGFLQFSNVLNFRSLEATTTSGMITYNARREIPSTEFEMQTPNNRVRVEGFTKIVYEYDQPSWKKGKISCSVFCNMQIYFFSRRGVINFLNTN